ncbi:GNAT family N-acetyltransferase [Rhodopseudomonas sp. AAP120]|uniref:GNAT family N-acetyltransferase n=1 Tax=Rhodopseudomonas sp. AAP120 TaxID=1523430 RepID=UPI0009E6C511|nr:GNAT family N-acetyltransferase [Rhodopseudomonas sp. AAP120]
MSQMSISSIPARSRQPSQPLLRVITSDGVERSRTIEVRIEPLRDLATTGAAWRDLEARAAPSFFRSWLWIGTWLAHLPKDAEPHLVTAVMSGQTVGMAVLCRRKTWRLAFRPRARWFLHETGDLRFDRLAIEYNGIVADRSAGDAVFMECVDRVIGHLGRSDQLVLSGITADLAAAADCAAADAGLLADVTNVDTAHWVDFDEVRRLGKDYRASLGRNTRQAVSRTSRLYEERGPVAHRVVDTVPEALAAFSDLAELHNARWGRKGAFANPAFRPFHEDLIARGVPTGAVRISRTTVGDQTIGVLYNFIQDGEILQYQSGFLYQEDAKLKPGLLSHVLAIEDGLSRGERGYDFMAGSAAHKSRLGNAKRTLKRIVVGRDTIERRVELMVRRGKRALAELRNRSE